MQHDERTCARCGEGFRGFGRAYLCTACRRPGRSRYVKAGDGLSPREKQVVQLVQKGTPNKVIAYELRLTEGTVKEYLYWIFRKVGCSNRTELAVKASQGGIS